MFCSWPHPVQAALPSAYDFVWLPFRHLLLIFRGLLLTVILTRDTLSVVGSRLLRYQSFFLRADCFADSRHLPCLVCLLWVTVVRVASTAWRACFANSRQPLYDCFANSRNPLFVFHTLQATASSTVPFPSPPRASFWVSFPVIFTRDALWGEGATHDRFATGRISSQATASLPVAICPALLAPLPNERQFPGSLYFWWDCFANSRPPPLRLLR